MLNPAFSFEQDQLTRLSQTPEWRALLHYFDEDESESRMGDFFLSPQGDEDALAELKATIEQFKNPTHTVGPLKQDPLCAFPARKEWLEKNGYEFRKVACKDFDDFYNGINPQSLTYVFSSAYPNNPASIFGHTMVRVNQGKDDPLLDYGVGFAAQVPENEIGLLYVPKGVFGLYRGAFEVAPYYQKVLEYNEAESRDLWEFNLGFTPDETRFWVKHLWELRWLSNFKYAFFGLNCSYQIMRSLQVIRPQSTKWLPDMQLYLLPGDTVRSLFLFHPELKKEVKYRPSHFKVLRNRYDFLSSKQRTLFKESLFNEQKTSSITDPYVLETQSSYYDYLKIQQQENVEEETKQMLRQVRVQRARLGGLTTFPQILEPTTRSNRPDLAHATRRFSFTGSASDLQPNDFGLRIRLGLHDLLNHDLGYEANFGVSGIDAELTYVPLLKRFRLKRFELFDLRSLQPIRSTHFPLSWRVFAGWTPLRFNNEFQLSGGVGPTLELWDDHVWTGFFVMAGTHLDETIRGNRWFSLQLEPYAMIRFSSQFKAMLYDHLETPYVFSDLSHQLHLDWNFSFKTHFELRLQLMRDYRSYAEGLTGNQMALQYSHFW